MFRWQPYKALLVKENANVALSGLNNMRSSQAKGPQQESVVKKKKKIKKKIKKFCGICA
jgi:hypothetical protein